MTEKKIKQTPTELNISEVSTNQQQQKVEKNKDLYFDAPNLTNEQRQQLGHASYPEKAPEFIRTRAKELITLKGYTTSQINQALKADNPYPARVFLKVANQGTDIPVFFRIKVKDNWIKPQIKPNSIIEIKGSWAINKEYFPNCKMRKSFTAFSYRLISCPHNQKKPYHCPVDCPCEKGKELKKKQEIINKAKIQFPYFSLKAHLIQKETEELFSKNKEVWKVKNYDK